MVTQYTSLDGADVVKSMTTQDHTTTFDFDYRRRIVATTRYDSRHRPIATTTWLTEPTGIDPNQPPIAGLDGIPLANGLTTRMIYDESLSDGEGLDDDISLTRLDGSGSFDINITSLLAKLSAGWCHRLS